jgi:hypothetical protein
MLPQQVVIFGQHPGGRVKVVVHGKALPHRIQVPSEFVFAGDGVDAGDVVDALMKVHANEGVRRDQQVGPAKVPVALFCLLGHFHPQT